MALMDESSTCKKAEAVKIRTLKTWLGSYVCHTAVFLVLHWTPFFWQEKKIKKSDLSPAKKLKIGPEQYDIDKNKQDLLENPRLYQVVS